MVATNEITGDEIKSKPSTDAYEINWDAVFGKFYCPEDCGNIECLRHSSRVVNGRWLMARPVNCTEHVPMGVL
jgi:hypothetical protein